MGGPKDRSSSELQRMMEDDSRTVTAVLEAVTGEPVFADVISRRTVRAGTGNVLGVAAHHALAQRAAVLRGANSSLAYLHAETLYVPERLSTEVLARLDATTEPIGSILADQRVRWTREPVSGQGTSGDSATVRGPAQGEVVWARDYRLLVDDLPAFAISEWFLRPVVDAMRHTVGVRLQPFKA